MKKDLLIDNLILSIFAIFVLISCSIFSILVIKEHYPIENYCGIFVLNIISLISIPMLVVSLRAYLKFKLSDNSPTKTKNNHH